MADFSSITLLLSLQKQPTAAYPSPLLANKKMKIAIDRPLNGLYIAKAENFPCTMQTLLTFTNALCCLFIFRLEEFAFREQTDRKKVIPRARGIEFIRR